MTTDISLRNGLGYVSTLKNLQVPGQITWNSSDESIASVDSNGQITIHTCGKATITATDAMGHKAETTLEGVSTAGIREKSRKSPLLLQKAKKFIPVRSVMKKEQRKCHLLPQIHLENQY